MSSRNSRSHTTNTLECLHRPPCKIIKIIETRASFPSDEAAAEFPYPAIRIAGMRRNRPVDRTATAGRFAILLEDRPGKPRTQAVGHFRFPRGPSSSTSREIEAVEVHHLVPGGDKVVHEPSRGVL